MSGTFIFWSALAAFAITGLVRSFRPKPKVYNAQMSPEWRREQMREQMRQNGKGHSIR